MPRSQTSSPVSHGFPSSITTHARSVPESQPFGGAVYTNIAAVHAQPVGASSTAAYGYGHEQANWAPSQLRSTYGSEFDYGQDVRYAVPLSYAVSAGDVSVGGGPLFPESQQEAAFPLMQHGAHFDLQGAYYSHMLTPTAHSQEYVISHGLYGSAINHVKQEIKHLDQPIPWHTESLVDPWYDVEHDQSFEDAHDHSASYAESLVFYTQDEYESPLASPSTDDPYYYQQPAFQHNRSYTLEAAIIPVDTPAPLPAASHTRSPTPMLASPHRSPMPTPEPTRPRPIMDHLPLLDEASMAELERVYQAFLYTKGKAPVHPQLQLQEQPPPPSQPLPVRRPRGRPQKHPLPTRSSPPPAVNYPYPQFPPASAESQTAPSSNHPDKGHSEHDHRYMDHLPSPPQAAVPMPDSEDRPGQAIFKLNTPNRCKDPVKKKPIMACLFCRERKIACGPPAPESPEQHCNQCARRRLMCEYPKESRRGQHKRGPRAACVQALADTAAMSGSVSVWTLMTEGDSPMTVDPIMDAPAGTSSILGAGGVASSVLGKSPVSRPGKECEHSGSSSQCARDVMVEKKVAQRAHQRKVLLPHVGLKGSL